MILIGLPPSRNPVYQLFALLCRQLPLWRWKPSGIGLLRHSEVLRRSVQRKVVCGFRGVVTQIARHFATRVLHYEIHMCLLIDIVEKRERRRKYQDPQCGYGTKEQNQFSLMLRRNW